MRASPTTACSIEGWSFFRRPVDADGQWQVHKPSDNRSGWGLENLKQTRGEDDTDCRTSQYVPPPPLAIPRGLAAAEPLKVEGILRNAVTVGRQK